MTPPTDAELRAAWKAAGGSFHGPIVETGTMAESKLLPFLSELASSPETLVRPSPEPEWKKRKAIYDEHDDGYGPYMEHLLIPLPMTSEAPPHWADFKVWASKHLGQGYSLACADGSILDEVTLWCFRGFRDGRMMAVESASASAKTNPLQE